MTKPWSEHPLRRVHAAAVAEAAAQAVAALATACERARAQATAAAHDGHVPVRQQPLETGVGEAGADEARRVGVDEQAPGRRRVRQRDPLEHVELQRPARPRLRPASAGTFSRSSPASRSAATVVSGSRRSSSPSATSAASTGAIASIRSNRSHRSSDTARTCGLYGALVPSRQGHPAAIARHFPGPAHYRSTTRSSRGRAQQTSTLPSAGASMGSGA